MNFRPVIIIAVFLIVGLGVIKFRQSKQLYKKDYVCTIGILQTASHPALDAAREGFMSAIQERIGDRINFVVRNGQGSIDAIHTIAQQFHAKDTIDGVFAIGTPAAQAMASLEKEKPLLITAVSVTGALQDLFSEKNICGVSDMINVKAEVEALKVLLPDQKVVGILYSTAEINSVAMSNIMVKELESAGYQSLLIGVTSEADIAPALTGALGKVDVILAPTDNMVANAIALIVEIMHKANKPLVVSDNMLVKYGALMARGVDYYESGRHVGMMALQVFVDGKKPHELSIVSAKNKEIFINKQVVQYLGIIIPDFIRQDVVLV